MTNKFLRDQQMKKLGFSNIKEEVTTVKPEKKKGINKVAQKRKVVNREYKKILDETFGTEIDKEPVPCTIKSPNCTGVAQGKNHKQKRSPKNITKRDNLEDSCNACNLFVELNSDWAKKNGHFISKFKPQEPDVLMQEVEN